jgi:hypothetical protein
MQPMRLAPLERVILIALSESCDLQNYFDSGISRLQKKESFGRGEACAYTWAARITCEKKKNTGARRG